MKVLVTGAGGFLGSALLERLLAHGYRNIRCLFRRSRNDDLLKDLRRTYPDARLEECIGNLTRPEDAARAAQGAELVFHVAASLRGAPADMFLNTVSASRNLLEHVPTNTRRVVLVSSLGVYGTADLPRGAVINENTPLETHPEWRDSYSHAKLRQELLFREYQQKHDFELIVLRPGVIYGPGGGGLSTRIGLNLFGIFLQLGHSNLLPLSYVQNCAEALVVAAGKDEAVGQTYNVYDDDLPTCRYYLREYKRHVGGLRSFPLPYTGLALLSKVVERYHSYSKGQLPAAFTTYTTAILWKGRRFDNSKVKALGWKQLVPTAEGMRRTFEYLRSK